MDILNIPFVEKVGITRSPDGALELDFNHTVHNHIATIHAGAQYALAESASGEMLQRLFPELVGKVVPVLRESQIKYRRPATQTISAYASVSNDDAMKFHEQFARKGRSSIAIAVEIRDALDAVTTTGTFNWFVQKLDQAPT